MARTFDSIRTEHGVDVIDDQGTRWATFEASDPHADVLGGYFAGMAAGAYAQGRDDAGRGHGADIRIHRSRDAMGRPTWDVMVDGDPVRSLGQVARTILDMSPPASARMMLSVARDVYAVGLSDHEPARSMAM